MKKFINAKLTSKAKELPPILPLNKGGRGLRYARTKTQPSESPFAKGDQDEADFSFEEIEEVSAGERDGLKILSIGGFD